MSLQAGVLDQKNIPGRNPGCCSVVVDLTRVIQLAPVVEQSDFKSKLNVDLSGVTSTSSFVFLL